jgi:hypothetical protein
MAAITGTWSTGVEPLALVSRHGSIPSPMERQRKKRLTALFERYQRKHGLSPSTGEAHAVMLEVRGCIS